MSGAGRGLGAAVAEATAREGAAVLVTDIREGDGRAVAAALEDDGLQAAFETLDVRDPEAWSAAVVSASQRWGPPTLLVNNAGIMRLEGIVEESEEGFRQVVDITVTGAFNGMRAVLPQMRSAGRGAIVNVTSTAAVAAVPGVAAYHAAKGALLALSRAAAVSYAADGIHINALVPGSMRTPMVDEHPGLSEMQEEAAAGTPMGRLLTTDEVAAAVVHLLSAEASYTIGSALSVDAGYLAQ